MLTCVCISMHASDWLTNQPEQQSDDAGVCNYTCVCKSTIRQPRIGCKRTYVTRVYMNIFLCIFVRGDMQIKDQQNKSEVLQRILRKQIEERKRYFLYEFREKQKVTKYKEEELLLFALFLIFPYGCPRTDFDRLSTNEGIRDAL